MKKKLLIVFLFAMLFSLTACQKEVVLPEDFDIADYNTELNLIIFTVGTEAQNLELYANDAEEFWTSEQLGFDVEVYKTLCAGTLTAREEAGNPVGAADAIQYEVSGINQDVVTVILPFEFENYTVHYEVTFEPNSKAEYNPNAKPYNLTQIVVSTQYPMGELMKMAGMNTLMGVGIVFLVLIFISFIISLFKYLPGSGEKKRTQAAKKEEIKPVAATPAAPVPASENPMNDQELVAVITAAVFAAAREDSAIVSSDQLIVRSIKRASR
ncbi:MAG: OadG family protein [Bacteroides sp.]|nr:OadG family protein [Bacteroides sp.]MCM1550607.1 OadG family protein [Clostridium sp.]